MSDPRSAFDLIYSALDAGRFSAAQAICERPELSKFTLAKALLAYCYASQRKNDKALELARVVAATNPTDEGTINALGCTFKICKADSDFSLLYENILSNPSSNFPEHFHVELFASYCRLRDFKKMQQQAQKMHRLFQTTSSSKYLFWAVTSMILQPDLPPTMLSVAEKMLSKVYHDIDTKRNPGAEEMELYLSTLVLQKKFDLAATEFTTITNRPAAAVLLQDEDHFRENTNKVAKQPEELTNILLDLNLHIGNIEQLIVNAQSILAKYPDQWNVWELLVDKIVFHRPDTSRKDSYSGLQCFEKLSATLSSKPPAAPVANPAEEEAADFAKLLAFNELILSSKSNHPKLRGPALAEIRMISSLLVLIFRHSEKSRHMQRIFQEIIGTDRLHIATDDITKNDAHLWTTALGTRSLSTEDSQVAIWLIWLFKTYLRSFQTKYVCFVDLKSTLYHLHQLKNAQNIIEVVYSYLFHYSGEEASRRLTQLREEVQQNSSATPIASATATHLPATLVEEDEGDEAGDDDEGGDDDEAEGTGNTDGNKADAANKKKKANRKKKNKNKKKNKKASGVVDLTSNKDSGEPQLKNVDVPALNAVVAKDEAILGRLCILGNFLECHVYLFFQLSALSNAQPSESHSTYRLAVHPHEVIAFFDAVSVLFKDGIGGELRTVRPGDTALTTVLAQCRQQYLLQSTPNSNSASPALDRYVHLLQWTGLLQHGLQQSPYSYAFKVDLLENYRALGNGTEALALFSESLGVKYIQNDSLSYLIIPTLLETGLFKEAAARFRTIVAFHRNCRRETLEMMGRAFEYGNYCKALEMDAFVEQSHRSLALSIAHVEGRVMDMITNIMSVMDLEQFYDMIIEENHDDTYRAFEDIDVSRLHNHQDFHLALDRLDNCPVASLPYQCDLMRKEAALKQRIITPTVLMQFTYHLLANEGEKLVPLRAEDISLVSTAPATSAIYPAVVERFPQGIASPTVTACDTLQTNVLLSLANLSLFVLQAIKPTTAFLAASSAAKSDSTVVLSKNPLSLSVEMKSGFMEHVKAMQLSLRSLSKYLLGSSYLDKSKTEEADLLAEDVAEGRLLSFPGENQYVMSAEYIRDMWSCVHHSLTWVSFLLQILVSKAYYVSSENSKMKRPVSADVHLQMQSVLKELDSIMAAPDVRSLVDVFDNLAQEQSRLLATLMDTTSVDKDDHSEVLRIVLLLLKEWTAFIVGFTRKLQRLQKIGLSATVVDQFAGYVSTEASFLPLPTDATSVDAPSSTVTSQVQALCRSSVEKTVRSTLSFHRDGVERASTILQQRLNGLRAILSL